MEKLITVYWRDIPAQVMGRRGRKTAHKEMLDPRFQKAIDRAAMRARRSTSDAYMADWRRESEPVEGDLAEAVKARVAQLEREFPPERLEQVIRAAGLLKRESE